MIDALALLLYKASIQRSGVGSSLGTMISKHNPEKTPLILA